MTKSVARDALQVAGALGVTLLWGACATGLCLGALALGGWWLAIPTFVGIQFGSLLAIMRVFDA